MNRDMVEWKADVIASRQRLAIPIMTHPGISLTGHTVREAVTHGRIHFDAVRAVAERYPTGAATMIMDLSAEAEAFGADIRLDDEEVPSIVSRTVQTADSVERLKVPDIRGGRLNERLAALSMAVREITDRPVLAECIGPLSLAGRLFDVAEMMMAILDQPETILALLEKCTRFLISSCRQFRSMGANGVIIAEPVAGMLPSELCTDFSSEFIRKIVEATQDTQFMVILHNCGETDRLVPSMLGTGAAGLHFGNKCTITDALTAAPPDVLIMGNVDPVGVLKMGSPDHVRAMTIDLLERTATHCNFVLSSGCDVAPHTPLENIDAFFGALNDFNRNHHE